MADNYPSKLVVCLQVNPPPMKEGVLAGVLAVPFVPHMMGNLQQTVTNIKCSFIPQSDWKELVKTGKESIADHNRYLHAQSHYNMNLLEMSLEEGMKVLKERRNVMSN